MILYQRYVNYSVFDGEITLHKDARNYLLQTLFHEKTNNLDIQLKIEGTLYKARLMNVPSSSSVQISYGTDIQNRFREIFPYSYHYWNNIRAEAKRIGYSTRKIPPQTLESVSVIETDEPFVYAVECNPYYPPEQPFNEKQPESEEQQTFPEGKKVYQKHVRHERNQGVVRLAKTLFKEAHNNTLYCEVCGFSFQKYGEVGMDFIEAHHTVPVSELGDDGITRVEDIRMVCSNCHRMLHRRRPWLSVEQLKQVLKQQR